MIFSEHALRFRCNDCWLYGIVSVPKRPLSRGVLIVVGGPQYRAGSHRQFALLARHLASCGIPVMRFDYRGMGDSEGQARTFEHIEDDLRHATNQFFEEAPILKELVIWGLCDAASAALFYAHKDPRVAGLVLLNPWVRTDEGAAKAQLKHYYLARVVNPELWTKIRHGQFDFVAAVRSMSTLLRSALWWNTRGRVAVQDANHGSVGGPVPLPERMFEGLSRFNGRTLLVLSGNDLTAREFSDLVDGSRKWKRLLGSRNIQRRDIPEANHTFSRRDWRDQVASWTREWVQQW